MYKDRPIGFLDIDDLLDYLEIQRFELDKLAAFYFDQAITGMTIRELQDPSAYD